MNIPEEALTAAQDAYWEGVEEARQRGVESVGHYLGVKAALSAAAPTLMARALRDAADRIDIGQDTANHHATVMAESWLLDRANELEQS